MNDEDITLPQEAALPFVVITRTRLALLCAACGVAGVTVGAILGCL